MEIFENTMVYVGCPANGVSGGPELLHQLCSELLRRGVRACMYYLKPKEGVTPQAQAYVKYHVPFTTVLRDRPENILVIPEALPLLYGRVHAIRKIFWWMSVDNFVDNFCKAISNSAPALKQVPLMNGIYCFYPDAQMEHWVQSEYARRFIRMNHVPEEQVHFVGDYLQSGSHLGAADDGTEDERQDLVAFNPLKGLDFTQRILDAADGISFAPIQNMTPAQVHDLLRHSKVYIDFGNHPGQDRIPREAAAAGCCVITGRRGAAGNTIDIPIPAAYKFADDETSIPHILACIRACFEDYDVRKHDFDAYRAMIAGQREKFRADVAAALPLHVPAPKQTRVVLAAGPHLKQVLAMLYHEPSMALAGVWSEDPPLESVEVEGELYPGLPTEDLVFLWQEGRFDGILLEPGAQKEAERLIASGLPVSALLQLHWQGH